MTSRLATMAVLICVFAGCRRCGAEQLVPPQAAELPTIELQPGVLLVRGRKVATPSDGGALRRTEPVRRAVSEALLHEPDKVPRILVAPSVDYLALYDAFEVVATEYGVLS